MIRALFLIVTRSLRQHWVSSCITALSAALACGLVMAVVSINRQSTEAFTSGASGFDAVMGARGSALQLVLNSVFHLETSPGNIPYKRYLAIKKDVRVKAAIPLAVGDNYQGFRIVGTTAEFFADYRFGKDRALSVEKGGAMWTGFKPEKWEAVVGSMVAQRTGLKVGDSFNSFHGLTFDATMKHPDTFTVVGVLEPTNTPADRVVWVPLETYYAMTGHDLKPLPGQDEDSVPKKGEPIPDEYKEVSAVMLKLKSPMFGAQLSEQINRQGNVMTLAWPIGQSMAELFEKIGWVNRVLTLVGYLIMVVAAGSILSSLYNTMNERKREFAILRALGARRAVVFGAIVLEAMVIAGLGAVAGYAFYAALLAGAASVIRAQTGVVLQVMSYDPVLVWAPLAMVGLGAAAGVVPAVKAYMTDVAANLVPEA
jgi:putative ABC transport system permease protein